MAIVFFITRLLVEGINSRGLAVMGTVRARGGTVHGVRQASPPLFWSLNSIRQFVSHGLQHCTEYL